MFIAAPISKSGYFFQPKATDQKSPGTLRILEGGKAELEITSTTMAFTALNQTNIGRLVGEVEGGYVTLENCYYRKMSLAFGDIPATSLIGVEAVFDGVSFTETPEFTDVRFCVDGLSEWFGESAFKINRNSAFEDITISLQTPEEFKCVLSDGAIVEIMIEVSVPGKIRFPVLELFQQAYIQVTAIDPKPMGYFQQISHKLTRFLSFVIGKTVALHSMVAHFKDDTLPVFHRRVQVYYPSLNGDAKTIFDLTEMLLRYRTMAPNLDTVLQAWLTQYDNLAPALHHYHSVQDGAHKYADTKFIAIAQALEALHRRTSDTRKWPQAEYKSRLSKILEGCPAEYRDWLKGKLAHGNEISLAERLHQLIDRFGDVFGGEEAVHKVVRGTVNTRNYHAHYDASGQAKAVTGAGLLALTSRLRVLFTLSLLVHLGYSVEAVIEIAKTDYLDKMLSSARYLDEQNA